MDSLKFSKTYLIATITILVIEIFIAIFVSDRFIRPFIGDTLAVVFVYSFLKIWIRQKKITIVIISLIFAFCIEALQAINFIELIGLSDSTLAKVILGTSFSWKDILAYAAGCVLILIFDKVIISLCTAKTF